MFLNIRLLEAIGTLEIHCLRKSNSSGASGNTLSVTVLLSQQESWDTHAIFCISKEDWIWLYLNIYQLPTCDPGKLQTSQAFLETFDGPRLCYLGGLYFTYAVYETILAVMDESNLLLKNFEIFFEIIWTYVLIVTLSYWELSTHLALLWAPSTCYLI